MSRSRTFLALVAALLSWPCTAAAWCLPPIFDAGLRLHDADESHVGWVPLLLRQHEVCWREAETAGEKRVFVTGASGIYGYPLARDESVVAVLNEAYERRVEPVHAYNLAHLYTYQMKDALILRRAVELDPDLLVHAVSLDDFRHVAPVRYPALARFMEANRSDVGQMANEEVAGLASAFRAYDAAFSDDAVWAAPLTRVHQFGWFARLGVRSAARSMHRRWFPPDPTPPRRLPVDEYRCEDVKEMFDRDFRDWKRWNVVAYLDELRRDKGVDVLLVNWPVNHAPKGSCYSVRYPSAALREFRAWLAGEARDRGIAYVDLHDLLNAKDFLDSFHPNAYGQRKIALRLYREIAGRLSGGG